MPFVYGVASGVNYGTSASANTEDPYMALRQVTHAFKLVGLFVVGKAAGATTLTGIAHRVKRATTAGSDGTALTPRPRDTGARAATTTGHDKQTTLTAGGGTVTTQLSFGHGAAGPGAWVARDDNSKINVEAGSSDELTMVSSQPGTSALNFEASCEIEE